VASGAAGRDQRAARRTRFAAGRIGDCPFADRSGAKPAAVYASFYSQSNETLSASAFVPLDLIQLTYPPLAWGLNSDVVTIPVTGIYLVTFTVTGRDRNNNSQSFAFSVFNTTEANFYTGFSFFGNGVNGQEVVGSGIIQANEADLIGIYFTRINADWTFRSQTFNNGVTSSTSLTFTLLRAL